MSVSQAALDEGLRLQQALHEVFSERDFLLNCLGTKFTKQQEKSASDALSESTHALESLSKSLVSPQSQNCSIQCHNDKVYDCVVDIFVQFHRSVGVKKTWN